MTEPLVRTWFPRVRLIDNKIVIGSSFSFDWLDGPQPRYFHVDGCGVTIETDEDGNEFFSLLVEHKGQSMEEALRQALTSVGGTA